MQIEGLQQPGASSKRPIYGNRKRGGLAKGGSPAPDSVPQTPEPGQPKELAHEPETETEPNAEIELEQAPEESAVDDVANDWEVSSEEPTPADMKESWDDSSEEEEAEAAPAPVTTPAEKPTPVPQAAEKVVPAKGVPAQV